jgi:hypothetical protein
LKTVPITFYGINNGPRFNVAFSVPKDYTVHGPYSISTSIRWGCL